MKSPSIWILFATLGLVSVQRAMAAQDRDYPVYYNPDEEPWRNPLRGVPKKPAEWGDITNDIPRFLPYDWSKVVRGYKKMGDGGNECEDRSVRNEKKWEKDTNSFTKREDEAYFNRHRQCPIWVREDDWSDDVCNDRHGIHARGPRGSDECTRDKIKFSSTPWGLTADYEGCDDDKKPTLDYSGVNKYWRAQMLEMKVPAEFRAPNGRRYPAEMHVHYKGGGSGKYSRMIGSANIWFEVGNVNRYFEYYLMEWEAKQAEDYNHCGKKFRERRCRLRNTKRKTRNPTFAPTSAPTPTPCPVSCSCSRIRRLDEDRQLLPSPNVMALRGGQGTCQDENEYLRTEIDTLRRELGEAETLRQELGQCREEHLSLGEEEDDDWEDEDFLTEEETGHEDDHRRLETADPTHKFSPAKFMGDRENYYKVEGSLTLPPCSEIVLWRMFQDVQQISKDQLHRLEMLIAKHIDPDTCKLATVGRRRRGWGWRTCKVDVNREEQYLSDGHNIEPCKEQIRKKQEEKDAALADVLFDAVGGASGLIVADKNFTNSGPDDGDGNADDRRRMVLAAEELPTDNETHLSSGEARAPRPEVASVRSDFNYSDIYFPAGRSPAAPTIGSTDPIEATKEASGGVASEEAKSPA